MGSVQAAMEACLSSTFGTNKFSPLRGSSRTDAGVHALQQLATVDLNDDGLGSAAPEHLRDLFCRKLRSQRSNIAVNEVADVPLGFSARSDSVGKQYVYRIIAPLGPAARLEAATPPQGLRTTADSLLVNGRHCQPMWTTRWMEHLEQDKAWICRWPLSIDAMQQAAEHMTGTLDFSSFRAARCTAADAVRRIWRVDVSARPYAPPCAGVASSNTIRHAADELSKEANTARVFGATCLNMGGAPPSMHIGSYDRRWRPGGEEPVSGETGPLDLAAGAYRADRHFPSTAT